MRSQLAERLGNQVPQIEHRPPGVVSLDAAQEAIDLADAYGVCDGSPLSDSQKHTLRLAMGERADRSWAASRVADFGPRQGTGKSDKIAVRELAGLILFGERLLIHTAHEFPTANESFLRMAALFENWDSLRKRVARVRYANGEQGIELLSGQRLKYRARSGGSGRGFAKADLLVYDEAQHLAREHLAASGPTKLANPNSQTWYAGSGGLETSQVAWSIRKAALAGDAGRLAYTEMTAEKVWLVDGKIESIRPDPYDRDAWYQAMAGLGRWVTEESMASVFDDLGPEHFARECLCVWDSEPGEANLIFPAGAWKACEDPDSSPTGSVSFALDVSPDRRSATIVAAAKSDHGGIHVEITGDGDVYDHRRGTAWVVSRVAELQKRWRGKVAIAKGSPAWSLEEELRQARIDLLPVTSEEHAQACGDLYDAVVDQRIRHVGQPELVAAIAGADKKNYAGDAWLWSRRTSSVDISPLVAATLAHWMASKRPARPKIL